MNFLPRQPTFKSDVGQSALIHEIVPDTITFRQDPRFRTRETGYGVEPMHLHHKTPFHEISMVPVEDTWGTEIGELVSSPPKRKQVDRAEFLEKVFKVFMDTVEQAWIPERFHIVLHSGGYDSRLISYAVRKLFEKNGPEWLGELLFVEVEGENEYSWAALKAEGWEKSRFIVYGKGGNEHHARSCNFANAWRRTNCGMWPRLFNYWYDPARWLQEKGLAPSDDTQLQGWSGFLANDIMHPLINGPGLDWALRKLPYHPYFLAPSKGECVFPFLGIDLIRTVYEYGKGQQEAQKQNFRYHILYDIAPDVAAVRNPQAGSQVWMLRTLSHDLQAQVLRDYRNSWYGKAVAPDAIPQDTVCFGRWWGHWGLASFCEHLLRNGYADRSAGGSAPATLGR